MLSVASALRARGHQVTFGSGSEHAEEAARAGVDFVAFPVREGSPVHALRPHEDAMRFAEHFSPVIRSLAPDVAVVDVVTVGAALACEVAGVPFATLSIHPLHMPSRDLPPFGWGAPPGKGLGRLRDAWMRRGNMRDLVAARTAFNEARGALGLPPTERIEGHLSPDCILVATLPCLEVPRSDWPPHAYVVGPCLWNAGGDHPEPPKGDGPLVLIAASTAIEQGALVRASLEAVEAVGARAILTTGKSAPPPRVPEHVVVSPFADHDAVMPACDVVICNGGHGVMARALTHGVPVIVVPGGGDQRENGYRVERARAGMRIMRPRAGAIAYAIRSIVTNPEYGRGARRAAQQAAAIDGPARAAELVEALGARAPAN
ncbi:MAG TPA: nucleotide disphospho-sugar-binding domain-containing protein [Actinomycetota bacterium]|nr:nucleotide disphospho-sugar-binding domain-containing protein [Actinomycetota bacterium]